MIRRPARPAEVHIVFSKPILQRVRVHGPSVRRYAEDWAGRWRPLRARRPGFAESARWEVPRSLLPNLRVDLRRAARASAWAAL